MTYYETPGVLSDVGNFMVIYYNEVNIIERYSTSQDQNNLQYYFVMKHYMNCLPDELHPFAYTSDKTASFITTHIHWVPFETVTYQSFIDYMQSDKFIIDFYHHWFDIDKELKRIEDISNFDLVKLVAELNVPESIKYKLYNVLANFERYRNDFSNLFISVYEKIIPLRQRYRDEIEREMMRFDNIFFYQSLFELYNVDISKFSYTIDIINDSILYFSTTRDILYLGIKTNIINRNIDMKSFSYIYNDPVRAVIIDFICKKQPVSEWDIFEYTGLKRSIARCHINMLLGAGIIQITKRTNCTECDISINHDYFQNLPTIFLNHFSKLLYSNDQ